MPLITDKFGKASINTDTAVATTVKTTRLPGVFVLEAFDLSKYAQDTPVFVVTYKKTTDPGTGIVSISNLISWKALVNPGANTLTNLTVQPGYTDTGNAVGDFIECIPTSAWENSLIDGILTSLNPDGTLKTSAVQAALNIANTPSVGWNIMGQALTVLSHSGNSEYLGTFNGDVTTILQPGMKLLMPRSIPPVTQVMGFNSASNQWASRASGSVTGAMGAAFATITTEAWVWLDSYPSNTTALIERFDLANNGWGMRLRPTGQLDVFYGGGGIFTVNDTAVAVPLGRWVHLAATQTIATKAVSLYVDGKLVPQINVANGATSMTAAGNIGVGFDTQYLNGKMGEIRVWSTIRTEAQIQANKDITLVGNEAGLVFHVKGNGNFNDTTVSANHLTANNGASAVVAMSSLSSGYQNATEYGYVTKVGAFAAGVTPVTVFTGTDCHLPSNGLGTIQYSNVAKPFGFPSSRNKWIVEALFRQDSVLGAPAINTWYNFGGLSLDIPTGEWGAGFSAIHGADRGAVGRTDSMATLSNVNNAESDSRFTLGQGSGNNNLFNAAPTKVEEPLALSAMTKHYVNARTTNTGINNLYLFGQAAWANTIIRAELAYT